jgi:hypothetical protein
LIAPGQVIATITGHIPDLTNNQPLIRVNNIELGASRGTTTVSWDVFTGSRSTQGGSNVDYSFTNLPQGDISLAMQTGPGAAAEGTITSNDAFEALKLAMGLTQLERSVSPYELISADVNQDGRVSTYDAYAIAQIALGKANALSPKFVFLEADQNLSSINRRSVFYDDVADLRYLQDGQYHVDLIGVLLGDVNHSYV